MIRELSILIPTYNTPCVPLVEALYRQAQGIAGLSFEIIVADDGSTDKAITADNDKGIAPLPHCQHIIRPTNCGRAAIRNFLAQSASYRWLLFMDCDVSIDDGFLAHYLPCDTSPVTYGGVRIGGSSSIWKDNLRYRYEKKNEQRHTTAQRSLRPHQSFRTTNFMVEKSVVLAHPFEIEINTYGYEDVLFGKELCNSGIPIHHLDNPVVYTHYEDNALFTAKTEEALETLARHQTSLMGYSRLLQLKGRIHDAHLAWLARGFFHVTQKALRGNLCGHHPQLWVYNLYRIGYLVSHTNS